MHRHILALTISIPVLAPLACSEDAPCEAETCERQGGQTNDAAFDGGGDAPTDPCVENPTDAKCLDESTSLFVSSPKGNDQDATGARDKPFKTLNAALKKIDQTKRRIYVCEGTYPEDVRLSGGHSKLSIFGGVDCAWQSAPAAKPIIGATANPFQTDAATGVLLADIAVQAQPSASGSSIAMFVNGGEIALRRVRVAAAEAADGGPGVLVPFAYPDVALLKGKETTDNTAAGATQFTCPGGAAHITVGGAGGNIGFQGDPGTPGANNNRGAIASCGSGGTGGDGAVGAEGKPGDAGASLGELTAAGWLPRNGASGTAGGPGQGGGGGYGSGGGGGGGGAGGCGGAGGAGGFGGGGSIGLAVLAGKVTVLESSIEAKAGGDGGGGVAGQTGQATGGAKGNGLGCPGGPGGAGGTGGPGAGGAAGISVAILYKGQKPQTDTDTEQSLKFGSPGSPGPGAAGNDATPGVAGKIVELK